MSYQNTISDFRNVLSSFAFKAPETFSEEFAQKRFKKKYQVPSDALTEKLTNECWEAWKENDTHFPKIGLLSKEWYLVRESLHDLLDRPNHSSVGFPKGSEFTPTRGHNSLEAKLCSSQWTVTRSAFNEFARIVYRHKGLKRAARNRYFKWFRDKHFDECQAKSDRILFNHFKTYDQTGFRIFKWKLERIVTFEEGSRFSTVPKNNEKRRPINIECYGNIVAQRTLGNWIRAEILRIYNIDLDKLATIHRHRISAVDEIATIDLKNASDRISLDLCKFLLPRRLLNTILDTRSDMVLGGDGDYHYLNKVSSMGNGFTFELMSLILTSVCRQLDDTATVFGDDIIIQRSKAARLIELLEEVGLQVNIDKSFTDGDFRESCGGNYHKVEGYIESYDFEYPESIGDCVTIYNKCVRLAKTAGYASFQSLLNSLTRVLPTALQGGTSYEFENLDIFSLVSTSFGRDDSPTNFPCFFCTPNGGGGKKVSSRQRDRLIEYQYKPNDFRVVPGFVFTPKLRSKSLQHLFGRRHWAKYEMYLSGGRITKDVVSGEGEWTEIKVVRSVERTFLASQLYQKLTS